VFNPGFSLGCRTALFEEAIHVKNLPSFGFGSKADTFNKQKRERNTQLIRILTYIHNSKG
jgi:hypothetical protein